MVLGDTYDGVQAARRARGQANYHAGQAAEAIVEQKYIRAGYRLAVRRWRGRCGEIDLIFTRDSIFAFVEVKSSRSHDAAAMLLGPRQQRRILAAAAEYLASADPAGQCEARIDVSLVNHQGQVKFLQNAIGH